MDSAQAAVESSSARGRVLVLVWPNIEMLLPRGETSPLLRQAWDATRTVGCQSVHESTRRTLVGPLSVSLFGSSAAARHDHE